MLSHSQKTILKSIDTFLIYFQVLSLCKVLCVLLVNVFQDLILFFNKKNNRNIIHHLSTFQII